MLLFFAPKLPLQAGQWSRCPFSWAQQRVLLMGVAGPHSQSSGLFFVQPSWVQLSEGLWSPYSAVKPRGVA